MRQTLERVDALDPNAQDARRLMSLHLPGLIDRYTLLYNRSRQAQITKELIEIISGAEAL